jgi:hypothetical protein
MVASKLPYYYTFQIQQENPFRIVNVNKWEEGGDIPSTIYQVFPDGRRGAGQCSCPAYKVCKHIKCVADLFSDPAKHAFPWQWQWSESEGWKPTGDMI